MSFKQRISEMLGYDSLTQHTRSVLSIVIIFMCSSCDLTKDNISEKSVNNILKDNTSISIDINIVIGNEWRKVCVQNSPYATKAYFEQKINEKLDTYELSSQNVMWIFYKNGTYKKLVVPNLVFSEDKPTNTICTTNKTPFLYLENINGLKIYYLNDKKI